MKLSQEVIQAVREAPEPPAVCEIQQAIFQKRGDGEQGRVSKPPKLQVWWSVKRLDGKELESIPLVRNTKRKKHYKVRSGALGQH